MENFTWAQLATVTGATALVTLIVQLVKADMNKWLVRLITYLVSVGVLVLGNMFAYPPLTWESAVLSLVHGVVVALAATGSYHSIVKPMVDHTDSH